MDNNPHASITSPSIVKKTLTYNHDSSPINSPSSAIPVCSNRGLSVSKCDPVSTVSFDVLGVASPESRKGAAQLL